MQNYSNSNTTSDTFRFWNLGSLLVIAMTLLPAIVYMTVIWTTTANTPQGDGYIQSIFTVVHYLDAATFADKLNNTLWTYFQHRAVFTKIVALSMYFILGYLDLHIMCFLGNLMLCIMVYLIARSIVQHRLPMYGMVIASLMILSLYSWTVATWPMCTIFYYGTLMLAFASFYCLDLPKPKIFVAVLCSWLAAFTMANGLLSVVIGSLIITYNHYNDKRYSSNQLILWSCSVAGCLVVHFSTMNVFSTDIYGAKSVEDSFINLSGRAVDFLESMGAAPFFPNENRSGKIVLGCIILTTMAALLTSKKSFKSPAIVGLMLFSTGTLFLTSLFRYSAGSNDGYQVFTDINMACIFIIGSSSIRTRYSVPLLLIMALAFNVNALIANPGKMQVHRNIMTGRLETFLVTGNPDSPFWSDVMTREGVARGIYRPLQSHQTLKIPASVELLDHCPGSNKSPEGNMTSTTSNSTFAMKISAALPAQPAGDNMELLLCGEKNYRLTLSKKNVSVDENNALHIEILIDKRQYEHAIYQAFLKNGSAVIALPESLNIPDIAPYTSQALDCNTIKDFFSFKKIFQPIITHYCQNN